MTVQAALISKISKMPAEQIKDLIIKLMDDMRQEAGVVLDSAMEALEAKIGTEAFVAFADAI